MVPVIADDQAMEDTNHLNFLEGCLPWSNGPERFFPACCPAMGLPGQDALPGNFSLTLQKHIEITWLVTFCG